MNVTIPMVGGNDPVLPDTNPRPTLTIDFRVYVRAYKGTVNLALFGLKQDDDAKWQVFYPQDGLRYPEVRGPWYWQQSPPHTGIVLDRSGWRDTVSPNTWHRIQITLGTDGVSTAFVDGVQRGTSEAGVFPNYTRTGNWTLSLGNFDGDIDELRINR